MSQTKNVVSQPSPAGTPGQQSALGSSTPRPRGPPLHKIYELPAPIRTFPLPSFYPNNPISLFHILFAWTKQTFFPPPAEPSVVYEGIWSPQSKSVNVVDEKSMRALWEQGFYGKGNLSRSEPNWLKREQVRRGLVPGQVSELVTASRREERRQMKWERAKSEQEIIRQRRLQETLQTTGAPMDTVNATDVTFNTPNGHAPEALAEAISLPEPIAPIDLEAGPESSVQATSIVTKDKSLITPTESKPGVVPSPSLQPVLDSHAGLVNVISCAVQTPVQPPISPTIVEPNDTPRASEQAKVIVGSAPIGPLEILRLPNSDIARVATDGQDDHVAIIPKDDVGVLHSETKINVEGIHVVPNGMSKSASLAGSHASSFAPASAAPVGPLELLCLPNTHASSVNGTYIDQSNGTKSVVNGLSVKVQPSTIPDGAKSDPKMMTGHLINDLIDGVNGDKTVDSTSVPYTLKAGSTTATELPSTPKPLKRRKSVRFSPKVESATYQLSDPPSPSYALLNGKATPPLNGTPLGPSVLEADEETNALVDKPKTADDDISSVSEPTEVVNKEHLQLTTEEAFFLSFGLGALRVVDPTTKSPIPTPDLLNIFRQYSYFPSRADSDLQPDDGFLVNYAVYHHFRSLGWVPRPGIKFGVDWMLYAKGPVFDHAEFGAIILPSYSDRWWKESDRQLPRKTWHWLHGVVRVLSHVQKSLVLVYVDVPPPPQFDEALKKGGPAEVFKLYKIREVMVKRWSSNRNR
ncbi:tRNA-splicing endonuclease subunit [Colletotrichum truncatum]|uniref:tRNA-splicing endonuclease subunit n=1 Tax=Colletotrichum truncatum TaxID=5467 RepID=A0ACC3ZH54_COLTU|nr:tRNA-splicing endonuclease subunit [Colletotrichum truncatum]KAF6790645.1 tRNA-splicing endonuclease subunit [Colletotrichum truncatum]